MDASKPSSFVELFHWLDQPDFRYEPPDYREVFLRLAELGVDDPERLCLARIGQTGPWSDFAEMADWQAIIVCRELCRERIINDELPPAWPVGELGIPRRPIGTPPLFADYLRDEAQDFARAEVDSSRPHGTWAGRVRSLLKTAWNAAELWKIPVMTRRKIARDQAGVCAQLIQVASCLDRHADSMTTDDAPRRATAQTRSRDDRSRDDKLKKTENQLTGTKLPDSPDVAELCKYLRKNRHKCATDISCVRDFCRKNGIGQDRARNLVRQAYRFSHLWRS